MTLLTRDQILSAQDLKTVDVDCPEWGGSVRVTMLTGTARDELGKAVSNKDTQPSDYPYLMVVACVVGEDGQRLFTFEDVKALAARSSVPVQRIFDAANTLNAVSKQAVEEAAKN